MSLMLVAMLVLPGIDAIAKWLSDSISAGQIAWSRFLFQTILMLPLFPHTRGVIWTRALPLHALRGALIALTTLLFFSALRHLPLADAISIFFVEPLILTALAAPLLGERVGPRRLIAVAVGLLGAMIVIRPGGGLGPRTSRRADPRAHGSHPRVAGGDPRARGRVRTG